MVRKAHASGETAKHTIGTTTSTWYTELTEEEVAQQLLGKPHLENDIDVDTIEAPAGSIIIFPGTTPHRSLNSVSDEIRWSCDFRLVPSCRRRRRRRRLLASRERPPHADGARPCVRCGG